MKYFFSMILISLTFFNLYSLDYKKVYKNNKAVSAYQKEKFESAEKEFKNNSIENPNNNILYYNYANALHKNSNFEQAEEYYKLALTDSSCTYKSEIYHNLGNNYLKKQEYEKALESYKKAMLENPNNFAARHNYEMAKKMQQQNKNQQKKEQNKQNDDKNKDKNEQKKDQNNQQNQQKNNEDKQKEKKENKNMDKAKDEKEADRILKVILEKEKQNRKAKEKAKILNGNNKNYW